MKRFLVLTLFVIVVFASFIPVFPQKSPEMNAPILLNPVVLPDDNLKIELLENHPSEYGYQNVSFEYTAYSKDVFSGVDGQRPFPWGGEVFNGDIFFLCSEQNYDGEKSFKIIGYSKNDHGAIAVPDLPLKPDVQPGKLYYLSFWVKYQVDKGFGFRLTHQFFCKEDEKYPKYACHGPWIRGTGNGGWSYFGLLVRAPEDAWKGDPVLELWGKGYVLVDLAYFGEVKEVD